MSPWDNLTAAEFEEFCYHLLEFNKFKNLKWYGKGGGDKGRDILATKIEQPLEGTELQQRWVIQCKHYKKAKISKGLISEWLAACREHKPDKALLIVSGQMSASIKDWLHSIQSEYQFDILTWEKADLNQQYSRFGSKLCKLFPQLPKLPRPIRMYPVDHDEYLICCDGFDEVGIQVWNAGDKRTAMKWAAEFINFIKANNFRFD